MASKISTGEKVRLSIGIFLLKDAPVIILDEPSSGLDSASAMIVIEKMEELAKSGKTLLISIHQPSEEILGIIDGLILMSKANMVFIGTIDEGIRHFASLRFEKAKHSVNPAYFSRVVAVDFRSREKMQESTAGIKKIVTACKLVDKNYKMSNEKVIFDRKLKFTGFYLAKTFLRLDSRPKSDLVVYFILIFFSLLLVFSYSPSCNSGLVTPYFAESINKKYYEKIMDIDYTAFSEIRSLDKKSEILEAQIKALKSIGFGIELPGGFFRKWSPIFFLNSYIHLRLYQP